MPAPYSPVNSNQLNQRRKIFLGADQFVVSGAATLTRGAKGNWYWSVAASQVVNFAASLQTAINDYASANVNYALGTTPNGDLALNAATAVYLASAVNLAAATLGVSESTFGVAVNPVVTDLIAPTALALPFSANIQEVTVTLANNSALILNPAEILVEAAFTTPAGGTLHFYGVWLDVMLSR